MSRHVRPSGDATEYTDALKAEIERLTAELDAEKEISAALTFDREQLRAELETERCLSFREQVATLEAQLTETRDLAEHWAILAEQRRVELGECRKDAAALWMMLDDIDTGGDIAKADDVLYRAIAERSHKRRFEPSYEWVTAYIAAMEAKP